MFAYDAELPPESFRHRVRGVVAGQKWATKGDLPSMGKWQLLVNWGTVKRAVERALVSHAFALVNLTSSQLFIL